MRRGEGCAIRWSDLNDVGAIRIDESVITASGGAETKAPKTRASVRLTAVDRTTMSELMALRERQLKLAAFAGVPLAQDGFVFSFEPGGAVPPHPDAMTKSFTKLRTVAGVPKDVHLHSLRHFQATALEMSDVASEASLDQICDRCPLREKVLPALTAGV
jgi:integrase